MIELLSYTIEIFGVSAELSIAPVFWCPIWYPACCWAYCRLCNRTQLYAPKHTHSSIFSIRLSIYFMTRAISPEAMGNHKTLQLSLLFATPPSTAAALFFPAFICFPSEDGFAWRTMPRSTAWQAEALKCQYFSPGLLVTNVWFWGGKRRGGGAVKI